MDKQWLVELVRWLPKRTLSRVIGIIARWERPVLLVRWLQKGFVATQGVDMAEAEKPLEQYPSLDALFVRRLRANSRPIAMEEHSCVSPVDGLIGACGTIAEETLLQLKGRTYTLTSLLADAQDAERFRDGSYCTLYLAPKHYHRIHIPLQGWIQETMLVPGTLWPVFPAALAKIDGLFARNERLITYVDTTRYGRIAVIAVGATMVGCITAAYDPSICSNRPEQRVPRRFRYAKPIGKDRGDELATFHLGSTVVVLFEAGVTDFGHLQLGEPVRMGQQLAKLQPIAAAINWSASANKNRQARKGVKREDN